MATSSSSSSKTGLSSFSIVNEEDSKRKRFSKERPVIRDLWDREWEWAEVVECWAAVRESEMEAWRQWRVTVKVRLEAREISTDRFRRI